MKRLISILTALVLVLSSVSALAEMRKATVVNTNGQYLAINQGPKSAKNGGKQIGRIPPGGVVTVDTSRTSGNWYYVTYNGVSGYSYNQYLRLESGSSSSKASSVTSSASVSGAKGAMDKVMRKSGFENGNRSRWRSGDCWNFCNAVSKEIYGCAIPNGTGGRYYLTGASGNKNWYAVGSYHGSSATKGNITDLLKQARSGDLIQYSSQYASAQHTAFIYDVSSRGVTIYDQSGNYGVKLETIPWEKLFSWTGSGGFGKFTESHHGLTLYRHK